MPVLKPEVFVLVYSSIRFTSKTRPDVDYKRKKKRGGFEKESRDDRRSETCAQMTESDSVSLGWFNKGNAAHS